MSAAENVRLVIAFEDWMLADLMTVVKRAYDESASMRLFSYSEERVQVMLAHAIFNDKACGLACVDMTERKIRGILIGVVGGVEFSDEPTAGEVFSYVAPDFRVDGVVRGELLEGLKRWAARRGIKRVILNDNELVRSEKSSGGASLGERSVIEIA